MLDSPFPFLPMPGRRSFLLLLALLLPALAPAAPGPAAPAPPPNIILITLDTTRADRMGFLGSTRGLTPHLDALAGDGIVFTRAYAQVPLTTPSHATLLTGTYPQFNHVNDLGKPLPPGLPYLPDLLRRRGYRTAAFVGSLILDPANGLAPGFERGFDVYDAGFRLRRGKEDRYKSMERRAGEVVAHALAWLQNAPRQPFFLWVHLYDAHDPYEPPPPFAERFKAEPYDGEIAYTDDAVGKLLAALRTRGLYAGSLVAVMADHGEAFGEHGEYTHGIFLYDPTIHVPLLFKLPRNRYAGARVESRAGLVDVMPTILQAAAMPVPKELQGVSLLANIKAHAPAAAAKNSPAPARAAPVDDDRPAYAETDYPQRAFGWSPLRALRAGKYLYVQAPQRELYDQAADPQAERNLAATSTAVSDTLASQLEDFRHRTSATAAAAAAMLDPEQAQKLSALGYVASETSAAPNPGGAAATDPKEKIAIANLMHDAILLNEEGHYEEAVVRFEKVLETEPKISIAQMQLGSALTHLRQYDKALPALRRAVELLPDNMMGRYQLGLALFETGDWQGAAPEFEAAVARAPKWTEAQFSLAAVCARIDRVPEALDHLKIALTLTPDHYRANLLNGRILSLQGHAAESVPFLEKAVKVQLDSREAHLFLADAYDQMGRSLEAARLRAVAAKLPPPQR